MTKVGDKIPLDENLEYPFNQATACVNKLADDVVVRNALLESFILNSRNLIGLFKGSNDKKNGDVTYKHFLNNEGVNEFEKKRNKADLDKFYKDMSHHASHLSVDVEKQSWPIEEIHNCVKYHKELLEELRKKHPKG